jgi:hypothetical protein
MAFIHIFYFLSDFGNHIFLENYPFHLSFKFICIKLYLQFSYLSYVCLFIPHVS